MHHLDVVEPIFPNTTRVQALQRLMVPAKLDSAGIMQQSICYDKSKSWTISVSWGFAVQIFRGVFSPREMEMPSRTFLNWYKRADYTAYAFNTRPVSRNPCQKPFVFYLSKVRFNSTMNTTFSEYVQHRVPHPLCKWKMADPARFEKVEVYKKPDPQLWNRVSILQELWTCYFHYSLLIIRLKPKWLTCFCFLFYFLMCITSLRGEIAVGSGTQRRKELWW